jgi:hypothetical protein
MGRRSIRLTFSGTTRLCCSIDARTSASASASPTVSLFAGSCKQKKRYTPQTKENLLQHARHRRLQRAAKDPAHRGSGRTLDALQHLHP